MASESIRLACSLHTLIYMFHTISSAFHRKGPEGACWGTKLMRKVDDLSSIPTTHKKSQAHVACTNTSGTGEVDRWFPGLPA